MKPKLIFPIITVIFIMVIWGHSMMPGEISSAQSGLISDIIRIIFGVENENLEHFVRKMAHFLEYMILGILISLDTILIVKKAITYFGTSVGLFVPMVDETIQLFVINRNGSMMDVWLDFAGFLTGLLFCMVIYRTVTKTE